MSALFVAMNMIRLWVMNPMLLPARRLKICLKTGSALFAAPANRNLKPPTRFTANAFLCVCAKDSTVQEGFWYPSRNAGNLNRQVDKKAG